MDDEKYQRYKESREFFYGTEERCCDRVIINGTDCECELPKNHLGSHCDSLFGEFEDYHEFEW